MGVRATRTEKASPGKSNKKKMLKRAEKGGGGTEGGEQGRGKAGEIERIAPGKWKVKACETGKRVSITLFFSYH